MDPASYFTAGGINQGIRDLASAFAYIPKQVADMRQQQWDQSFKQQQADTAAQQFKAQQEQHAMDMAFRQQQAEAAMAQHRSDQLNAERIRLDERNERQRQEAIKTSQWEKEFGLRQREASERGQDRERNDRLLAATHGGEPMAGAQVPLPNPFTGEVSNVPMHTNQFDYQLGQVAQQFREKNAAGIDKAERAGQPKPMDPLKYTEEKRKFVESYFKTHQPDIQTKFNPHRYAQWQREMEAAASAEFDETMRRAGVHGAPAAGPKISELIRQASMPANGVK